VIVGVFNSRSEAERAVAGLRKAGFADSEIGLVTRHADTTGSSMEGPSVGEGAAWGAVAGAGVGGLVGWGILAGVIPVLGPVIAGGALATILANAAGGAIIGGLVGALTGLGLSEEEASYYEDEVKAGRSVVTVKAGPRAVEADAILARHGAHNFHRRPEPPMTVTPAGVAFPTPTSTIDVPVERDEVIVERPSVTDLRPGEEIRIPVKEEHVRVEEKANVNVRPTGKNEGPRQ
jgi:hypothetical protein